MERDVSDRDLDNRLSFSWRQLRDVSGDCDDDGGGGGGGDAGGSSSNGVAASNSVDSPGMHSPSASEVASSRGDVGGRRTPDHLHQQQQQQQQQQPTASSAFTFRGRVFYEAEGGEARPASSASAHLVAHPGHLHPSRGGGSDEAGGEEGEESVAGRGVGPDAEEEPEQEAVARSGYRHRHQEACPSMTSSSALVAPGGDRNLVPAGALPSVCPVLVQGGSASQTSSVSVTQLIAERTALLHHHHHLQHHHQQQQQHHHHHHHHHQQQQQQQQQQPMFTRSAKGGKTLKGSPSKILRILKTVEIIVLPTIFVLEAMCTTKNVQLVNTLMHQKVTNRGSFCNLKGFTDISGRLPVKLPTKFFGPVLNATIYTQQF